MNAEQAIERLRQRNQAFVNRIGKTTDYSRETDEIINALSVQLFEKRMDWTLYLNVVDFGRLLGIENLCNDLALIPRDVFSLVLNGCDRFRHYESDIHDYATPIESEENAVAFDREHPDVLVRQLKEAGDTWEKKQADMDVQNAFDEEQIRDYGDGNPELVSFLQEQIRERGKFPKDLI